MIAPKIWRIGASIAPVWFTPDVGCKWFKVCPTAAGGGGCGSQNSNNQPPALYGRRGGDSMFGLHPAQSGMFAMNPAQMDCYINGNLGGSKVIFFDPLPPDVTGIQADKPYWPINMVSLPTNVTKFNLSATPYSPPFGGQSAIVGGPLITNPSLSFRRVWYGVEGGGGGGQIGDQGTPLGYWGLDEPGPDGYVQSWGKQGGPGGAGYRTGGPGGNGRWGGAGTEAFLDFGIPAANLTGAGGGGAAPSTMPSLFDFGGTGGAAGAFGEIFMTHIEGQSYFCWAGVGGAGGPAGATGYPGGAGGHGEVLIEQHF